MCDIFTLIGDMENILYLFTSLITKSHGCSICVEYATCAKSWPKTCLENNLKHCAITFEIVGTFPDACVYGCLLLLCEATSFAGHHQS